MKNRIALMAVICFAAGFFLRVYGEAKIGMQTPYVWMCTVSADSVPDGRFVWRDLLGNGASLMLGGEEFYNDRGDVCTYNFHPSLSFGSSENASLRIEGTGLQKATVIGVYGFNSEEDHTADGFVMNISNGTDEDETAITKAKIIHSSSSSRKSFVYKDKNLVGRKPSGVNSANNREAQKNLRIMSYTKSANPRMSIASSFSNISIGGRFIDGQTTKDGVYSPEDFQDKHKVGRNVGIPELLVYDRALTDTARLRSECYLALKYGITLDSDYVLDSVVWKSNSKYARVCGYGRLDRYNFSQLCATTSEREMPYYLRETFYGGSSFNRSAYENLIVAGRYGVMSDNTLFMCADNDAPVELSYMDTFPASSVETVNFEVEEDTAFFTPVKRIWRMSNLSEEYFGGANGELDFSGADVEKVYSGSYNVKVAAGANARLDNMPAFVRNGEISWVVTGLDGDVVVSMDKHIFKFDATGSVFVNNKKSDVSFKVNDMIEVVRKDSFLYVRKNGLFQPSTLVKFGSSEADWSVLLVSGGRAFCLNEFHVLSDAGSNDFIELSYDYEDSLSFYSNGNIYLLMSDTEDFGGPNSRLRAYRMSARDRARSKVFFENLDWQPGVSYFTFAVCGEPEFGIADKKYIIEEVLPQCVSPNSSATGSVAVTFPDTGSYAYTLARVDRSAVFTGSSDTGSVRINNLWNGDFVLYISPNDGAYKFNIEGECEVPETIYLKNPFCNKYEMSASWIVGDSKAYSKCGFATGEGADIIYGVVIENGRICKVENGYVRSDCYEINDGDTVTVAGTGHSRVGVFVNGVAVFEISQSFDVNLFWAVSTVNGKAIRRLEFREVHFSGCIPVVEYEYDSNFTKSEHLRFKEVDLFSCAISMYCDGDETDDERRYGNKSEEETLMLGKGRLVALNPVDGSKTAFVRCYLPEDINPVLHVTSTAGMDMPLGMELLKKEAGLYVYQAKVSLSAPGVYPVYVMYNSERLSDKVIIEK